VRDQVLWMQRNVFHRGRFLSVREVGIQTDDYSVDEDDTADNNGVAFSAEHVDTVCGSRPGHDKPPMSDATVTYSSSDATMGVPRESRAASMRKSPRSSRSTSKQEVTQKQVEEVQQHVMKLTSGALDRACALAEHVEDLNHQASAALIRARHFQYDHKPSNAYECTRHAQARIASAGYIVEAPSRRNNGKKQSEVVPTELPDLMPPRLSARSVSTKMPWQEWSETMSGCPTAAFGCKVLLSSVEPWRPSVLSELPSMPQSSLRERLAVSAAVYTPCGAATREVRQKPLSSRRR